MLRHSTLTLQTLLHGANEVPRRLSYVRLSNLPILHGDLSDDVSTLVRHLYSLKSVILLLKVTDGVHVAVGFALCNSILLEAPAGVIVIDTTESSMRMKEIWREFRKISDKPLKAIIYTQSKLSHIAGTDVSNLFSE